MKGIWGGEELAVWNFFHSYAGSRLPILVQLQFGFIFSKVSLGKIFFSF
jgi:hypothetical protein